MKKLHLLFIGMLSMSTVYAQDISDALRFSQNEIQGTARFRALSGAFGALGGDMSAVSLNPAGSAVFAQSHASFTASNTDIQNNTNYFNGLGATNESHFDISQGGAAFVFANNSGSPWKKLALSVAYDQTNNFNDNWYARGTNTNNQSIDLYFLNYADGIRLGDISLLDGEFIEDAYRDIGEVFGFAHQQAFLGYQSFILEPDADDDDNTTYFSNLDNGTFDHDYTYAATGYNGKVTFNLAAQYEDNLYVGLNLNSHFIDYQRSTLLLEDNANTNSLITQIDFGNTLSTRGNGFSFQLGGIMKLSPEFRVGLTYDSPTWFTIEEETTQFIDTNLADPDITFIADIVNIYPRYRLQTPAKVTGSLAYVFANQGLISFDYSKKDYGKTKFKPTSDAYFADQNEIMSNVFTDASTYRIGGEYKHKQFSFRGGYRFEESPYADGVTVGDLNGFSLGIGYNFGNTKLDITYDEAERSFERPLYNVGLTDAVSIDRKNSNITLSLSFNI
ncbi:outer membrane protein transport protein [Sabulilitoribacter multivorans]|uniref:Outer membrane protein transport protein n=1 Tax=Flaviramulus multivorans TaxID=1304750 RepID=A0ABS9ILH5_9FLAO|nr:outer membrane protein transport protein [Flaviramulus multivorans]MCF7561428.1 outer membrane protein transport protein [Flaviramulus multivorans]